MSIARMINAFGRFLQENNIEEEGVKVVIEFEDVAKAHYFCHKMYEEFAPSLRYGHIVPEPHIKEQRIYGIPVEVKAVVKVGA